ncbi:hypothetical protein ACOMHN_020239 [Nucella lapillus]
MSLDKNEFENLRLYAKKCDHRNMAPMASFDLASDLRKHKGRGGRMFEKRKQRTDKYIVDDESPKHLPGPEQDSVQRQSGFFAPIPAIWKPPSKTSKPSSGRIMIDAEILYRMNRNNAAQDKAGPAGVNLTEAERLQKLYKILGYVPPGDIFRKRVMKGPKVDLRSQSHVTILPGRDFNRNAKGWCSVDGDLQKTANLTPRPEHLPGLLAVDTDNYYYYYCPADFSPEAGQEPTVHTEHTPRPKSWHSVRMKEIGLQDDALTPGDYNPRPKAWQPAYDDVDGPPPRELGPFGDYNPRPKAWLPTESEDPSLRGEVHFGDYNPRPKAWRSTQRGHSKAAKGGKRFGDYNPRPKAWQSSERGHFVASKEPPSAEMKFGDYNPRPKAWKSDENSRIRSEVRYGDYNPRPKAWRSAPEDDSSSTSSSYSSTESSDDDYSYGNSLYLSGYIPACDV